MNKWVAIPTIAVLIIAVIVVGYLYFLQTSKLRDAQSEITNLGNNIMTLESEVASLENIVSDLKENVSTLETNLTESEAMVTTLNADLETANNRVSELQSDVSTQRTINSSLTEELKLVKDPRHFSSIQELTDWLDQDDTDIIYSTKRISELAYILQVKALRDGYLLPVDIDVDEYSYYVSNAAVIGDSLYWVWPDDDSTEFVSYVDPIPSHPLPLD